MSSCSLKAEVTPAFSALHWDPCCKRIGPPPFVARRRICVPKAPRTSLFKSSLVLCFFLWSSCSTICGITIFPLSPPFGTKAPCDLCHVIGAYSAAFTTAESGTKKCFHDWTGTVWTSFAFVFVSSPVCAVVVFHRFERQGSSGTLPDLRLKTIPVSLQKRGTVVLAYFPLHRSKQCRTASILAKFLLLDPIPRPACGLDRRRAFRVSPFFSASLS